ncbi:hypothetical protein ES708_10404 [subsurface metagenome]
MKLFRFTFSIDDDIEAQSKDEAWEIVKKRIADRYYGPTHNSLELIEDLTEPVIYPPAAE